MLRHLLCVVLFSASSLGLAHGEPKPQSSQDTAAALEAETRAAFAAANVTKKLGPVDVPLVGQATLKLPEGYAFVPRAEAEKVLHSMGNRPGDDLLGMIFPVESKANWFIVMRYIGEGYIKDDDAKEWNADDLLTNLKEGTEEGNKERKGRGIPEMEIVGWVEKPAYDAATHRLVWSLSSKDKGAADSADKGVNYNTYALGREGYISMNLVTDLNTVEAEKPIAKSMLAALQFNNGKRYSDFNSSTDHVAEYGLAALVGGVALKKLGLFALAAGLFAKFFKLIAVAVIAGLALVRKFFGGKKDSAS